MVAEIQSALASLCASLPDASLEMRHGEEAGLVLSASSRDLSGEAVSADGPQEMRRVVARRCDFPSVAKGSAVELDGALHLVTGARADPVGASLSLGLSGPFGSVRAAWTRRGASFPVPVLALEDAALPSAWADAAATASGQSWTVCVPAAEWPEPVPPQAGDDVRLDGPSGEVRLRVASAARDGGWWTLRARPRGSAW